MYNEFVFNLFAHLIRLDGAISDQEIEFIHNQLRTRFPTQDSDEYYRLFLKALENDQSIEVISKEINRKYKNNYLKKIKLVLSAYELLGADSVDKGELAEFNRICIMIQIDDQDRDLINSLLIDSYDYDYLENTHRKISAGPDSTEFDLLYERCNLEIFYIRDHYFLVNKGASVPIFLDRKEIYTRHIECLENCKCIYIGDKKINIKDLGWIFNRNESKILYFRLAGTKIIKEYDEHKSDFKLDIDNNIIRCYRVNNSDMKFSVGEEQLSDFLYLNIADIILLNENYKICCLELIESQVRGYLDLNDKSTVNKKVIISNNRVNADIYVESDSIDKLELLIQIVKDEGFTFIINANLLSSELIIDDRILRSGESLLINNTCHFILGNIEIELNSVIGDITTSRIHFSDFIVKDLQYTFKDGNTGVDNISFSVKQGELIAIMGASGAGKSTLFQLLLGYLTPQKGQVLINGHEFYKNFDQIKNYIGYVPQDDLLFENLSVYDNLQYTARIRLPDIPQSKRMYIVDSILKEIGLFDKKQLKVGSPTEKVLSGGQRKRLNIGMELIASPDLFFLDEPTSGLSSKDSEMILNILYKQRKSGKIIFVIIHQPSSELYKIFDKLLLLDVGGKLAYFGDNLQAIDYFKKVELIKDDFIECPACKKVDPEIIFNVLEKKELGRDGFPVFTKKYNYGSGLERIIRKTFNLPMVKQQPKRRYDSSYWKRLFLTKNIERTKKNTRIKTTLPSVKRRSFKEEISNTLTLVQRSIKEKFNDRMNLFLTFLAPLLLSSSLAFILKGSTKPYQFYLNREFSKFLFISVIIFIFLGLMASVNEIIKDRPILLREKILNIKVYQYIFSKAVTFSIFGLLQVVLYTISSFYILRVPFTLPDGFAKFSIHNYMLYFILFSFVITYCAFSFGLFISSLIKSQMLAFNLITLIIIPQIVLGGLFLSFDEMGKIKNKNIPFYANLTISRWGYEGLLSGSEYFNPLFQVTSSEYIQNHRRDFERKGVIWDYYSFIDTPIKRLKENIIAVPKTISKELFDNFKKETIQQLKEFYILDRESDLYMLKRSVTDISYKNITDIFRSIRPKPFYSQFNTYHWNKSIEEDFIRSNTVSWLETQNRISAKLVDWIVDYNIYPAHNKVWGIFLLKTVWFNLIVLLLQALICNLLTYIRLNRL